MDKWWKYIREGKEPKRSSPAGVRKGMDRLLNKGPQTEGSPYENVDDDYLKDKKSRNDVSAPPSAPGGGAIGNPGPAALEEEVEPESFEKHSDLDPKFWEDRKLKEKIKRRLTKIVYDFIDGLNVGESIRAEDIRLTGSLANYNWSKYSDVDIHIVVDFKKIDEKVELVKAFFDAARMRWNELHDIMIYGHEVEIYVENINEDHRSSGIYSLMNDEWIVEPSPERIDFDYLTARKKADAIQTEVNMIAKTVAENPRGALKSIDRLKNKIRTLRKAGLYSPEKEYASENIAFKILRREDALQQLNDMKYDVYDRVLSIGE